MSTLGQEPTKFNLELSHEWLILQTHKWRRPKWVKFPRSILEDARWINLSDRAKAAWPSILLIASENASSRLPNPDALYRRLREVGVSPRKDSFSGLIDELIQCGFILKTTPELQSYRDTELQIKKEGNGFESFKPKKERGFGEEKRMRDDPIPTGMHFLDIDSEEYAAWSEYASWAGLKRWPQRDFRVNGRTRRGWVFPSLWPTSELKPKLNGGSAPQTEAVG